MREIILKSIIGYIEKHQYPPTIDEICEMVGLKSKSSVHNHLKVLMMLGALETDAVGSPRALRIPGYRFVKEAEKDAVVIEKCTGICKECPVDIMCKVLIKEERNGESEEQ